MKKHGASTRTLREKAVHEFKEVVALTVYLYVCLGPMTVFKSAVLQSVGIDFTIWGITAIKALILAKFMLVARAVDKGGRFSDKPLIWLTTYRALVFIVVLLALTTVEELVTGAIRHRAVADSLRHVVGATALQGVATCLIMLLVLLPYCAFIALGDIFGESELLQLFFVSRSVDVAAHHRLAGSTPLARTLG